MIFHFYVPDNWKELKSVKLHFNCLKYYIDIFDEVLFVLSVNNPDDKEFIVDFELALLKNLSFHKNIQFKVVENHCLYESKTLYDELVSKMDQLDGLTFFGHSKGIGNELFGKIDFEQLEYWLCGMYFLSLNFIREVESNLYGVWGITYGPFKSTWKELDNKYHWIYSGTFFWINAQRMYDKIKRENIELRHCDDRFFSELFLGDICDFNRDVNSVNKICSHCNSYLIDSNNYYDYCSEYLKMLLHEGDLNDLYEFKEKVCVYD